MENNQEISKKLLAFDVVLLLSIIVMVFNIYDILQRPLKQIDEPIVIKILNKFDDLIILARSAYVLDVAQNKIIYQKNETAQLPLASLTKLMTALIAVEMLLKDSHITIRKEFLEEEGDTGLLVNESWKLQNLLDMSLVVSSNDAARSVASVVGAFSLKTEDYTLGRKDFIEKMNTRAKELGLQETYFINESGLDVNNTSGGYGSAIDVANLMKYILINKPELLEATKYMTVTTDSFSKSHIVENTNTEVNKILGLIASKTGYTTLAGGNLAVVFDASIGRPIIIVVLGSTEHGRFSDVEALVKASLKYISE